jgi:UPF0755 protein
MADELDPKKYHVFNKKQKIIFFLSLFLILVISVPTIGFWYYNFALNRPSQTAKEVTFEIKKGQLVSEIADNLYESGAINSKFLFNFYAVSTKLDRNIQAGIYTLPAGMSIKELVGQFQHGKMDQLVTFLEGWRVEEFAREAASKFQNVDYYEFITLAAGDEGYLFPDTYIFNNNITASEMIEHLKDVFEDRTENLLSDDYLEKSGLTAEQAIVFASILERETSNLSDRPIVAGILIKRWKEDMKIEADATTQYVVSSSANDCNTQNLTCANSFDYSSIDWWPRDLTVSDLSIDSPYNTRKNLGLPPKPISSISISALQSVINYTTSDYYFYINDDQGTTHFGATLADHEANIAKYLSD